MFDRLGCFWAWYTAGWVQPVCVSRALLSLFSSAGGWPGYLTLDDWTHLWCGFDGYSGTLLSSERLICVCVCLCAATSPDTTSACSTHTDNYSLRQQVWHTPSCIHMCLLSNRTSLFHWHAFEKREMTSSLSTHHPFDIIPQQINLYQGQCLLFPPIEEMNLTFNHIVFQDRKRF